MLDAGTTESPCWPESFAKLTSVSDTSNLHDNRLRALSDAVFGGFIHLRYLNLGDIRCASFPLRSARSSS